jgi:hypothetical protein
MYKTNITQTEEGFEVTGEVEGDVPGKISIRGRWIADLPSSARNSITADPPLSDQ